MSLRLRTRTLATAVTALGLVLALTACSGDNVDDAGATTGSGSSTDADTDTKPDGDKDSDNEKSPALDHEGALAAAFNQELAVVCGYTYDEEELASIKILTSGEAPPDATIYLDRGAILWDIPQSSGKVTHMLIRDGSVYTWKASRDGKGAKAPDLTSDGGVELQQRVTRNAHDCKVFDGPASTFQPPNDITFVEVG